MRPFVNPTLVQICHQHFGSGESEARHWGLTYRLKQVSGEDRIRVLERVVNLVFKRLIKTASGRRSIHVAEVIFSGLGQICSG